MPPTAVVFDFNGTISHDEPLLAVLFREMFAEIGIDVTESLYFEEFAGYSDRLLDAETEIDMLDQRLRLRLADAVAARCAERQHRPSVARGNARRHRQRQLPARRDQ